MADKNIVFGKAQVGSNITVKGKIHNVTYRAPGYEPGGFAIIKFDCDEIDGVLPEEFNSAQYNNGRLLCFSGITPSLSLTKEYNIFAELVNHKRYGLQYKIVKMSEDIKLDNSEDVEKFFAYMLPEATASAIMKTIPDPIAVMEAEDIKTLTLVPGVGPRRAQKIIQKYKSLKLDRGAFIKMYSWGLTLNMIQRICDAYHSADLAVKRVEGNPYDLIYTVRGIGWIKADEIAYNMGIAQNDPRRIKGYIYYLMITDGENNGNTFMNLELLVEDVLAGIKDISDYEVRLLLSDLINEGRLYFEKETKRISLMEYRQLEENIAYELKRISEAAVVPINGINECIEDCQTNTGFIYTSEQRRAIVSCLTQNVTLITALAGAGKTTSMYPVAQCISRNNQSAALVALSGKASLNLSEVTRIPGRTIHRLLGYNGNEFTVNKNHPLRYDVIILDEASMVDERLFLSLLQAIPSGCKLIMVGDVGQLEPIGLGCVFRDLVQSNVFSHIHFSKIFRQAAKSGIITESHKVYNGINIMSGMKNSNEIRGELEDFEIISIKEMGDITGTVIDKFKHFYFDMGIPAEDIAIMVGKRAIGDTSCRNINTEIQKIVNPDNYPNQVKFSKKDGAIEYVVTFKPNDRIIVTRNCYDTINTVNMVSPVFNGNIGTILDINNGYMKVRFNHDTIIIERENFNDIELGYAITVHKAQGSGFPYVITVCDNGSYALLSKEWLYTAITRAKKYNVLIAQPYAVKSATGKTGVKDKRTWLGQLILDIFQNKCKNI